MLKNIAKMKSSYKIIFSLLIGIAWILVSNSKFQGLNSAANLLGFGDGLLTISDEADVQVSDLTTDDYQASVLIDTLGIPHVYAADATSGAFSLGYMQAADRSFQMELLVNTAKGQLSEMIGPNGVGSDWFWKSFNLEEKAKASFERLKTTDPELYRYLEAYSEGVNQYLSSLAPADRDPLYAIWDYEPREWQPHNAFYIQWYMSMNLAYYDDYVDKQEIVDKLPPSIREVLYPEQPSDLPTIVPQPVAASNPASESEGGIIGVFDPEDSNNYEHRPFNRNLGSNNWVVGNSRTKEGQIFLCNDLHLFLVAPNLMYEFHLKTPGVHVYGYTVPGLPFVLTGHNQQIAWGITNGGWDVTEQYLLKINPENPNEYWLDGAWQTLENRPFTIQVKGGNDVQAATRYTVHGPIKESDSLVVAIKWHPNNILTGMQSFWELMYADNWEGFRNALRTYDYPAQNFIYGDVNGNIGVISAGKMPIKPAGYNGGLLDGTQHPKANYIAFDSLPYAFNPAKDYLFSANQKPLIGNQYFSSRWFEDLYRPQRINELLQKNNAVDYEYLRRMQLDVVDRSVRDLQSLLRSHRPELGQSEPWKSMLEWDGALDYGSENAALYTALRRAIDQERQQIAQFLAVKRQPSYDQFVNYLLHGKDLDLENGKQIEREAMLTRLIHSAEELYQQGAGLRTAYDFAIPQMTFLPVFNKTVHEVGGSENTINVNYGAHSVIRTIVELDTNGVRSYMVNATGQSGKVDNEHYYQQLDDWKTNRLHATQFYDRPEQLEGISRKIDFSVP